MSEYLDRLERELVAAARREAPRASEPARVPASVWARAGACGVALLLALGLVAALHHSAGTQGLPASGSGSPPAGRPIVPAPAGSQVSFTDCDVAWADPRRRPPTLVRSPASPGAEVIDHVRVLRRRQRASDRVDLGALDRRGLRIVEAFPHDTRVLRGPDGARLELIPARICGHHGRGRPFLALLAVVGDRPSRALLWASGPELTAGAPTLRFASGAHRLSATIDPAGVIHIRAGTAGSGQRT